MKKNKAVTVYCNEKATTKQLTKHIMKSEAKTMFTNANGTKMEGGEISTIGFCNLTANLRRRHDLPTPESPISKSLNK